MLRNITFKEEEEYSIRQIWDDADQAGLESGEE
jgi:hypothetical protein